VQGAASDLHLAPLAGRGRPSEAREGEGALHESKPCGKPPHPDPLPASGAREKHRTAGPENLSPEVGDLRFRALLSALDWASLPPPVRRRFSKRVADGRTVVYVGEIIETRMSAAGYLLAQAARLIGAPFPISTDSGVPSVVSVTEDLASGGQIWTRLYARRAGFPQVIHSSKRFCGPTGLEEHVGGGVGMALTLHVEEGALVFRSAGYFVDVLGRRLWLPAELNPGVITVTHAELGDGRFSFTLDAAHPRLGELIHQLAVFREVEP
jgi:hypothetical protein